MGNYYLRVFLNDSQEKADVCISQNLININAALIISERCEKYVEFNGDSPKEKKVIGNQLY